MLAIQPRGLCGTDEELGAVSVGAGVGHGEDARPRVLLYKVLIGKLLAVDRLSTGTVAPCEVTALAHEPWDHTVERRTLEVQRLAGAAGAFLAGTQRAEVLRRLWHHIRIELHHDPAGWGTADLHIKENLWVRHPEFETSEILQKAAPKA